MPSRVGQKYVTKFMKRSTKRARRDYCGVTFEGDVGSAKVV